MSLLKTPTENYINISVFSLSFYVKRLRICWNFMHSFVLIMWNLHSSGLLWIEWFCIVLNTFCEKYEMLNSPLSVLLSAVSGEDTQDRTDRLLLTPWVKFLWESYRQCLDLLRNNSKVERLYHDIAQQGKRRFNWFLLVRVLQTKPHDTDKTHGSTTLIQIGCMFLLHLFKLFWHTIINVLCHIL